MVHKFTSYYAAVHLFVVDIIQRAIMLLNRKRH